MTSKATKVKLFIKHSSPVEQALVVEWFGEESLRTVRRLMEKDKVSYDLDWNLQWEGERWETRLP
jgi:hypothetical protein